MTLVRALCSQSSLLVKVALLAVALPVLSFPAAITINTVCYLQDCEAPDSIGVGQSSSGTFNYLYTFADGDQYSITGNYDNSYPSQHLAFSPTVTYLNNHGNIFTPAVQTDVLSLLMIQYFYDPTGSSWDGQYCQTIPFEVAPLARANGNTYFDGNGIGFAHGETGTTVESKCADLTFTASQNASPYMRAEILLDFTFLGGNLSGAQVASHMPEPVQTVPVALGLITLATISIRSKRTKS